MTDQEPENPHPTQKDKDQDAERKARGTGDSEPDIAEREAKEGGNQVEGSTFTDQGRPV